MNAELIQKALEKVGNSNTLINMVSCRVRQLTAGGGGINRPLVADTSLLGAADIALREIIEEKLGWDLPAMQEWSQPAKRKRSRARPGATAPRTALRSAVVADAA